VVQYRPGLVVVAAIADAAGAQVGEYRRRRASSSRRAITRRGGARFADLLVMYAMFVLVARRPDGDCATGADRQRFPLAKVPVKFSGPDPAGS